MEETNQIEATEEISFDEIPAFIKSLGKQYKSNIFRHVIESNSTLGYRRECLYYSKDVFMFDEEKQRSLPKHTIIKLVRPVFDMEHLEIEIPDKVLEFDREHTSHVTYLLDAVFNVVIFLKFYNILFKSTFDPIDTLLHHIAINFYDCLSTGCSRELLQTYRTLLIKFDINKTLEIYPKENAYHTVDDFLEETKEIPEDDTLSKMINSLFDRGLIIKHAISN